LAAGTCVETSSYCPAWKSLLAFATIYFAWGSTFFAIRGGDRDNAKGETDGETHRGTGRLVRPMDEASWEDFASSK
jgi:hypothetical protein